MLSREHISKALAQCQRKEHSPDEFPGFARAAVLIPLFPTKEELSILLTVRTDEVETHKGQISFPGGVQDTSDTDAIQTALREADEELGITRSDIEVLGLLDDMPLPSKFIITPVVGYLKDRPVCSPNLTEVAEVFDVPLAFFADEKNGRTEERELQGRKFAIWHFQYGKHIIWGATAGMIRNLIEVARRR